MGEHWVGRVAQFTLRRLRDDVEQALLMYETDLQKWQRTGGLPEDEKTEEAPGRDEQQKGAKHTEPRETRSVRLILALHNFTFQTSA